MILYPYNVRYARHSMSKTVMIYAPDEENIEHIMPSDAVIEEITPLNEIYDSYIRRIQRVLVSERFNQQKIVSLLEMLDAAFSGESVRLNALLKENITHKKLRQMQYELCSLYMHMYSGFSLAKSIAKVLTIPKYMSSLLDIADRTDDMKQVFKSSIAHYNYLLSRNYRISKIIYIQIFLVLTEAVASHYMAKTKFSDYFFSIKFRGDNPPVLAQIYVDIFANIDITAIFTYAFGAFSILLLIKVLYRVVINFRTIVDYIRLHIPFCKDIDFLSSQLNIYRALRLTDDIHMTYDQSLQIVYDQIDNIALQNRWKKIVANHEQYSMNTHEMIDVLIANSSTTVRPEPGTMKISDSDIHLLELDLQQRYFRLDMTGVGFGLVIAVAIPLWGVIAFALTQNYYWLQRMSLGI